MKITHRILAVLASCVAFAAHAQVPVTSNPDQEAMLRSADPQLAKNKRFVYDFWREVFEAAHMDLAPWFDMFRSVDGKIAEHWDPAVK